MEITPITLNEQKSKIVIPIVTLKQKISQIKKQNCSQTSKVGTGDRGPSHFRLIKKYLGNRCIYSHMPLHLFSEYLKMTWKFQI